MRDFRRIDRARCTVTAELVLYKARRGAEEDIKVVERGRLSKGRCVHSDQSIRALVVSTSFLLDKY